MEIVSTDLSDVKLIHLQRHSDARGWFAETFQKRDYLAADLPTEFVQENQSHSRYAVLRGLHYQIGQPQGKLVRAISGHIWDVAVDLRRNSPDFGKWAGFHLHAKDLQLLWIPEGFAHGFLVLSESAEVLYKTTDFYHPESERCIRWDDPTLKIDWPIHDLSPIVSNKDALGAAFLDADLPDAFEMKAQ